MAKRATAKRAKKRRSRGSLDVLGFVAQARDAAAKALKRLRAEIRSAKRQLERLRAEERTFRLELFGGSPGRPGRRSSAKIRRRGPAKAERFFAKLPARFTLEQVRNIAGRLTGASLAQWSRARKVRKVKGGYRKV